jgi:hypothetical protein
VRKLSRAAGMPTPTTTPPISQRPSVIDDHEVTLANAQMRQNSGSSYSSQTSPTLAPLASNTLSTSNTSKRMSTSSFFGAQFSSEPPSSPSMGMPGGDTNVEYLKNLMIKFVESNRDKKVSLLRDLQWLSSSRRSEAN